VHFFDLDQCPLRSTDIPWLDIAEPRGLAVRKDIGWVEDRIWRPAEGVARTVAIDLRCLTTPQYGGA
jgi:hypothetical protein